MQSSFLPFLESDLKLTSDGRALKILDVVRVVPNKRWVCRGVWGEQAVYAKIFLGQDAMRYALRDKAGVDALDKAQIRTPALLLFSELKVSGNYVLIYSAIDDSKNVEQVWGELDDDARHRLAQKLVSTVAQHHRAGLLQTDLYLKNFLVQGDTIYTIDGDGIRSLSRLFGKRQELQNLATLFSKMDVLDNCWIAELYTQYCLQLGVASSQASKIKSLTHKIRHQVECSFAEKKVFRNCTDVKVTQGFRCFEAVSSQFVVASEELHALDPFLVDAERNLKNGNTCTINRAVIAGQQVVIKRYNIKGFWHGLNRAFRPTRAAKSWVNAHRLIISNIATPKPLALVEERFGFFRHRAYYLSEYVDAPDVFQFFVQSTSQADKKIAAYNIATLFYKLYLLKFSHGDCKASNIKIVNLAPALIDLDGLRAHFSCWLGSFWFERKHIKDLQRFMKNWDDHAEVTVLLKSAFIRVYSQESLEAETSLLFRAGIT